MIKSMTGYGKSTICVNLREYYVEIKSVNHRYLDTNIKMPRPISYLEEEIKKQIASNINRGKLDIYITFEDNSSDNKSIKINDEIAKIYIDELKRVANEQNISSNIEITEISKFPDVLRIKNIKEDDETIKLEFQQVVQAALNNLISMRKAEGEQIAQDLLKRIEEINIKIQEISELSTRLIEEYVVKLEKRIKELLNTQDIDENRIAQEVVIYADKCSIQEEVTRMNSHILQFKSLLNSNEAIGKKLDFLIQEMNRETNTIGSKANNLDITNRVIDIKTQLENIREQIQNIE